MTLILPASDLFVPERRYNYCLPTVDTHVEGFHQHIFVYIGPIYHPVHPWHLQLH